MTVDLATLTPVERQGLSLVAGTRAELKPSPNVLWRLTADDLPLPQF
jgi:hypothetical protein